MACQGPRSSLGGPGRVVSSTSSFLSERDLPPTPRPASPVPSFSDFQGNYISPWMRDSASTASTARHSRASSIVSTLTRFTTSSVDDARSIDISVGGQNFRIARDASKITSEAPPPYSAAEETQTSFPAEEVRPRTAPILTPPGRPSLDGSPLFPRSRVAAGLGANILDPSEVDIPSPVGDDDDTPPSTPRTSTRNSSRRLSSISPVQMEPREDLSRSATVKPVRPAKPAKPVMPVMPYKYSGPRQRADLPLLSTTPNAMEMQGMRPRSTLLKPWQTMSANDLLLSNPEQRLEDAPPSPSYIGREAAGVFPPTLGRFGSSSGYGGEENRPKDGGRSETPSMDEPDDQNDINDISLHYARMIRFVDKQHRRALHARDKGMEQLRERLSEVDVVYRQQLKAKDFIIEDLKKRLDHLEDSMEVKLEKARNETEDLWERRWKDRDYHLRERIARLEGQASRDLAKSRENFTSHDENEQ